MESTLRRNRSSRNNYGRRKSNLSTEKRTAKIMRQIIISITIFVIMLTIRNIDTSFTNYLSNKTVNILNTDTEISLIIDSLKNFVTSLNITNDKLQNVFNGYGIKVEEKQELELNIPKEMQDKIFDYTLLADIEFEKPVQGVLTSDFGNRINPITKKDEFHNGIDVSAPEGEDVKAILDGVVIKVESSNSLGNYVKIRHPNNLVSLYAHTSFVNVGEGELINKGDVIGKVGSTGWSNGPHLHLELWKDEKMINVGKLFNYENSEVVYN